MQQRLVTGAAGDVGTRLRKLLPRASIRDPLERHPHAATTSRPARNSSPADLADYAQVEKIVAGIDGIVHLGGYLGRRAVGRRSSAPTSSAATISSRRRAAAGVKRVVFASSNHAVGFYPREQKIGVDVTVRPDSRYGVSKAFGEALGVALCRQARPARDLPAHRQCRRHAARRAAAVDLAHAARTWCS